MIKKIDIAVLFFLLCCLMLGSGFFGPMLLDYMNPLLAQALFTIIIGLVPFLYSLIRRIPFSDFIAPGVFSWKLFFASILTMFGTIICSLFLALVSVMLFRNIDVGSYFTLEEIIGGTSLPCVLVVIAVLPAICEEIVFRGFILRGLKNNISSRKLSRSVIAVGLCALMFAVLHMDPIRFLSTLLAGIVLSYVGYITGSLVIPMVMHFFNNGLAAVCVWYMIKISDSYLYQDFQGDMSPMIGIVDSRLLPGILSVLCVFLSSGSLFLFSGLYLIKKETAKCNKQKQESLSEGVSVDGGDAG